MVVLVLILVLVWLVLVLVLVCLLAARVVATALFGLEPEIVCSRQSRPKSTTAVTQVARSRVRDKVRLVKW
jgi:sensor histidine kinase regulating citrate/malate metabolism